MYKNLLTHRLRKRLYSDKGIEAEVLRLDLVHPIVSGNKWFKLKYYLKTALESGKKGLLSFGGAYSNHLVALAYSAQQHGLASIGIIRGEEQPGNESISQMRAAGMQLHFVSRMDYRDKNLIVNNFDHEDYLIIPEGGHGLPGIQGAEDILSSVDNNYSHIICAAGTGTTLAGIINSAHEHQKIIGIPVIKIGSPDDNELLSFLTIHTNKNNFQLNYDYHHGGYARKTSALIDFMNNFYAEEQIPTDFVYTGKLFYAVNDLVAKNFFPPHSRLLVIHSGGLQGNRSLPAGELIF